MRTCTRGKITSPPSFSVAQGVAEVESALRADVHLFQRLKLLQREARDRGAKVLIYMIAWRRGSVAMAVPLARGLAVGKLLGSAPEWLANVPYGSHGTRLLLASDLPAALTKLRAHFAQQAG